MAITTNLLQNKLKADLEKKLDPMKIGLLVGLVLGVGVVMYYMVQQSVVNRVEGQVAQLAAQKKQLDNEAKTLATQRAQDEAKLAAIDGMAGRINHRFFWAPILEVLWKSTPPTVQITNFNSTVNMKTGEVKLNLECTAAGEEPRSVAEGYRNVLLTHFKTIDTNASTTYPNMIDSVVQVELDGKKLNQTIFSLGLTYTDPALAGKAAPPPAPAAAAPARATAGGGGEGF
jgi:hypothetical protein